MARIEHPTSKDLIVALNDMNNSWVTICNGIDSLKRDFEEYGIHDWFNHALETQYVDEYNGEDVLLGEDYDYVFVRRDPKTLKMTGFCEDTIDYIYNNAQSLQSESESIKDAHSYNPVSRPNKTQVIEAFNELADAMYTFACGVGGYYGVSDAVEKDLGKDWFSETFVIKPHDHPYYDTFASSYDEGVMAMDEVRDGFVDYIKDGGKIKFKKSERHLKIRVHYR